MPKLELDHLIVAGPDLGGLVAAFAALTGARAVPGGRHAGQGTHNALVGLGRGRYLELLAPDPEQADGDFRAGIAYLGAPALHTWCARAGAADDVASRIAAAGLSPRRLPMARQRPGGVTLRWELVFADGHPYAGMLPFFIDWRGSPHPSEQLAPQLAWEGLTLAHPDARGLGRLLAAFGGPPAGVRVEPADAPVLTATWRGATAATSTTGRGGPC
jgi:hypothetical protein